MSERINISLLVESDFDEQVLRKLIRQVNRYEIDGCYGKKGKTYLKEKAPNFNNTAKGGYPFILLTDLDQEVCPLAIITNWLPQGRHPNFVLRIAVREIEAWLLADRSGIADFLQIPEKTVSYVSYMPDEIVDPKSVLIDLARQSRSRQIREDIVPAPKTTSKVGKNYNSRLLEFVLGSWQLEVARQNSPSLDRAYRALLNFKPVYPD